MHEARKESRAFSPRSTKVVAIIRLFANSRGLAPWQCQVGRYDTETQGKKTKDLATDGAQRHPGWRVASRALIWAVL